VLRKQRRNSRAAERSADESPRTRRHANGPPQKFHKAGGRSITRGNREGIQAVQRTETAEKTKGAKVERNFRDKQPEPRGIKVELFCICNHAFADSRKQPCLVGIIDVLQVRGFPASHAILSVAAILRTTPHAVLTLNIQFGASIADLMRESGAFKIEANVNGLVFVPFHMPQLRFDEAGEYVARLIDLNDDHYIMATKYMRVIGPPSKPAA